MKFSVLLGRLHPPTGDKDKAGELEIGHASIEADTEAAAIDQAMGDTGKLDWRPAPASPKFVTSDNTVVMVLDAAPEDDPEPANAGAATGTAPATVAKTVEQHMAASGDTKLGGDTVAARHRSPLVSGTDPDADRYRFGGVPNKSRPGALPEPGKDADARPAPNGQNTREASPEPTALEKADADKTHTLNPPTPPQTTGLGGVSNDTTKAGTAA